MQRNSELRTQNSELPVHIGFIMDGNRRWAKGNGKLAMQGHEAGVETFYRVVRACHAAGVKYVSAYTFSTENWARSKEEVSFLMGLVPKVLKKYLNEFHKDDIRIAVLGTREGLSSSTIKAIENAEQTTANNKSGTVALCFNYGGRQELVDMVKNLLNSGADIDSLKPDDLGNYLYHPEIPPCDLIVRTSGEKRLSGFMLARSEYAEFIFEEKLWPELNEKDVAKYLNEFSRRTRRYGS